MIYHINGKEYDKEINVSHLAPSISLSPKENKSYFTYDGTRSTADVIYNYRMVYL